jgi:N-acetylglucosamine-6-sulfatase
VSRTVLLTAGFALLLTVTLSAASKPPNLVVVIVDDLRWDDIGAAGHPFVRTPHIDRLAREGVRFPNAFATTPLCSPSRASILTGLYAHRHGILDNTDRSEASHRLPTFPRQLQKAGYEAAFMGKWHMGNDDTPRPGFDHWVSLKGQGEANDPQLNENGRRSTVAGYVTDLLSERALDFVSRRREAPFFLLLAHKALHPNIVQHDDGSTSPIGEGGFIPAPRHRSLYAAAPIPRRGNYAVPPRGKPALERRIGALLPLGPATATPDETVRDRLRMLAAVDESLGRILEALERSGALDETVIVLVGDNGYFYGEHGLSEERRLAYEESIRIPLLLRYPPAATAGATPAQLVLNIDIAPTLLELAGVPPERALDGRSLVPLLRGEPPPWRDSFLIEYFSDTVFPRIERMGYQALRTQRHKYIRYLELQGMDEVYDLEDDPFELRNLMGSPEHEALRVRLRQELERLRPVAPVTPPADARSTPRPKTS